MDKKEIDTLLYNAYIITVDENRVIYENGAVAIKDGVIVDVGKSNDITVKYHAKESYNCNGGVVHPGLVDAHEHLCWHLTRGWIPDTFTVADTVEKFETPLFREFSDDDDRLGTLLATIEMAKNGITAFGDTGSAFNPIAAFEMIGLVGIRGFAGGMHGDNLPDEQKKIQRCTDECLFAFEEQLSTLKSERVCGGAGILGMGDCSDKLIVGAKELATKYGRVLHMHQCVYRSEIEMYTQKYNHSPIKHLESLGILDSNTALVHMIHLDDDDIEIIRKNHISIVHCPGASIRYGLGSSHIGRFPEMLSNGISISLGSDAGNWCDSLDVLRLSYLAATLHRESRCITPSITIEQALEMATINGARALGLADITGSITRGKRADIVIHSTNIPECNPTFDPLNNLIYSAQSKSVNCVLVEGEFIVKNRRITRFDEMAVYKDINCASLSLARRMGYSPQHNWTIIK